MRRMFSMMIALAAGGGLVWGGMNYHVLQTNQGVVVVHKRQSTLSDTYADVREWGLQQWTDHPDLVAALSDAGRADVIENKGVLKTTFKQAFEMK